MSDSQDFTTLRRQTGMDMSELANMLGYSQRALSRWERGENAPRKSVVLALQDVVMRLQLEGAPQRAGGELFRFIDLFAGIGGFRRGFDAIGGKCVFTSEWDRHAQYTYWANYHDGEDHIMTGDITKVEASEIPEHDLLLAGFPCQPFSIAGVSKKNAIGQEHGFRCKRQGNLFFDIVRILGHHRPRIFVLENVKNLVNHDRGNTFRVIRHNLEEVLGYRISTRVINAKCFVPQHRERIFIVGFREEVGFDFESLQLPDAKNGPRLGSILHTGDGSEPMPDRHYTDSIGRVRSRYTLTDHLWQYLQRYAERHRQRGNGFGFTLCGPEDVARTISARYYKDGSEVLVRRRRGNPRRLTPRECSRLMGFDGPGEANFRIPVSDVQAYRQFGNAVAVPVVEALARHLAPYLLDGASAKQHAAKQRAAAA